jgi:tRNA (guanine37-N1)-methyltransferase
MRVRCVVVTLFPDLVASLAVSGVVGRALREGLVSLSCVDPREFTEDRHRTVDDRPYGGGPGMVMKAEPVQLALREAKQRVGSGARVVYLSPQGRRLCQQRVNEFALRESLILLAGRYEGVDERLLESCVDEQVSIGDYVLSGGELPAMVLLDAVIRQLPGALGHADSAKEDSFADGLLDCPHYTRPEVFEGRAVPEVLLSGNHEAIRRWRLREALGRTWRLRPDLLASRALSREEMELLRDYRRDYEQRRPGEITPVAGKLPD